MSSTPQQRDSRRQIPRRPDRRGGSASGVTSRATSLVRRARHTVRAIAMPPITEGAHPTPVGLSAGVTRALDQLFPSRPARKIAETREGYDPAGD
ncbi:MAG TPA: hypothetical protein VF807_03715 [Ktedonobacterales bacterium]